MLVALLVGLAAAAPASPHERERLMSAFDAHFTEGVATAPAHAHAAGAPGTCLTGLVADLKAGWHHLSPADQRRVSATLSPGRLLVEPPAPPAGPPPPPEAPCFGYVEPNHLDSEHFSVQWADGTIDEADAQDFLDALELSWAREVDELGWLAPDLNGDPMLVQVIDGNYAGAYTTVDRCGSEYAPYVVAYEGSFNQGIWHRIMAAHEFNHASQFSYGYAHEFWWWEATATWMEEYVYPSSNDWSNYVWAYGEMPEVGLNASAGNSNDQWLFYHTYAMAIFAFYLDWNHGGHDAVLDTWKEARTNAFSTRGYDYWMPDVINDTGLDWDEVWTGFLAAVSVMDFDQRGSFPRTPLLDTITALPAEGSDDGRSTPQSLGANYIRFDEGSVPAGTEIEVTVQGVEGPVWYGVLVRGSQSREEVVRIDFDENGLGTARIVMDGESPVTLAVSPMDEQAQGYSYRWTNADTYAYTWSAVPVVPDDGGDTGAPVADDTDAADDEKGGLFAGCASVGAAPGGALALLALGLVGLRRRRG